MLLIVQFDSNHFNFDFPPKKQLNMRNIIILFFAILFCLSSPNLSAQKLTEKETIEKISKNKWFLRRYESKTQFYTVPKEYQGTYMAFSSNGKVYYYKKGDNEATKPRYDYKIYDGKIAITSHEGTKEVFDFELKDYIGYKIYFGVRSGDYAGIKYVWEQAEENKQIPESAAKTSTNTTSTDVSEYHYENVDELAAALNKGIRSAKINFLDPRYSFNITGSTSFTYSSIEFFTKNNELYIRMNFPQNGTCDYGLKETKAILTKQFGYSRTTYYIAFKYQYSCNSINYETIYANFYCKSHEHYEAMMATAKRLIK